MRRRRIAAGLLALLLGAGAAVLVACGGDTRGGIPPTSAERLKEDFEDVRQAVDSGRCEDVTGQLRQVGEGVDNLPRSVDNALQDRLREAVSRLDERAIEECNENQSEEETETTTTEELPEEEPPVTETTPPTPTTTTEVPPQTTPPQTTPRTTTTPGLPPDEDPEETGSGGTPPGLEP